MDVQVFQDFLELLRQVPSLMISQMRFPSCLTATFVAADGGLK